MFSSTGTTPLAFIEQTEIKIRLGRNIDAAQHESESDDPMRAFTMIVAAD